MTTLDTNAVEPMLSAQRALCSRGDQSAGPERPMAGPLRITAVNAAFDPSFVDPDALLMRAAQISADFARTGTI